jgi:4-carboxymuconolactone decarboxylase
MSFDQNGVESTQRIEMANPDALSESQKEVYKKIINGKRGKIIGPLRVVLHSPELADTWQEFGEFVRYNTKLEPTISELAIITTARHWDCQVEWMIHSRIAKEVGVKEDIIEAIRTNTPPQFETELEKSVYEFTRETLGYGQVNENDYKILLELLGNDGIVELSAVVGYYAMVAMTLNVHHVPVPEGETSKPLPIEARNPEDGRLQMLPTCRMHEG